MASETKATSTRRKASAEPTTGKTAKTSSKAAPAKKKAAVAEVAAKPAAARPRKTKAALVQTTPETRLRHIEVAAYYIAEKRGFGGNPADDWLAAEQQIDHLLLAGQLPA